MITNFTMYVGLSGSGKSYQAVQKARRYNALYIESDGYREQEHGDASVQGNNTVLFDRIHKDIVTALSAGQNVVFDATNLSRGHRVSLLQKISKIPNVWKECVVMATPYKTCLERNASRPRVVPEFVIRRQRESFNVPLRTEGWNDIYFSYDNAGYDSEWYNIDAFIERTKTFSQDNPHHTMTLGNHCEAVSNYMATTFDSDELTRKVALLHDCGKEHTKTFKNAKGDASETAHYYNHENVGSYEAMFYLDGHTKYFSELIWGCALIEFHMRPYYATSEKALRKLLNLVGDEMYELLYKLNEADRYAH